MSKNHKKQKPRRGAPGDAFGRAQSTPAGTAFGRTVAPEPSEPSDEELARQARHEVKVVFGESALALQVDDLRRFDDYTAWLTARCDHPVTRAFVTTEIQQTLDSELRRAWEGGWQPADVHRMAVRRSTKTVAAYLLRLMHHQLRSYARDTVHPSWHAQLAELRDGSAPTTDPITGARADGMSWLTLVDTAARALYVLRILPPIESIGPRPGEWTRPVDEAESVVDERILNRVRMLLAKAESTPYEAEAETFTAGAESLIARHRISEAMLAASRTDQPKDGTAAIRIGVDNPYEQPKVLLLVKVAEANSCQVVWASAFGFATVVGFPSDLAGVELLYTSLLLQATNAMTATGKRSVEGAHKRSRSFRSSFLGSFAQRIGERLQEAVDVEERAAAAEFAGSTPGARLPALIEREQDVADATTRLFPEVVHKRTRMSYDPEGWRHGRQAADQADMHARTEVGRR